MSPSVRSTRSPVASSRTSSASLQRRLGKTVLFVTHDIREACRIADRLAIVDGGRLIQHGRASDLIERPADDFVRSFFRDAEAVTSLSPGGAR